ncbi:tumor protein p63-regulated gene 1-like protein isoform X1 [Branchiostoma floridae]|uniref:Tumor protein p63-regulated gene 1-like protein isoform X1 n=1 Tax=Branchiostoma floridae TaxID=7739 RepID=A0A9J7NC66_BRAFL|nr:tumor protein p63-regulated gene 1-like protein isoform X1 [Branchiostoma floridae]
MADDHRQEQDLSIHSSDQAVVNMEQNLADEKGGIMDLSGVKLELNRPETAPPDARMYNGAEAEVAFASPSAAPEPKPVKIGGGGDISENIARGFFAYRPGAFDLAVETTKSEVLLPDVDGSLRGAWLLTEIDHWDSEKERLVLLTDNCLIVVFFDFVASKIQSFKRIVLKNLTSVKMGPFEYPPNSIMPRRAGVGVQMFWSREEVSAVQKWNPFNRDIPYAIFASHPLIERTLRDPDVYRVSTLEPLKVETFHVALVQGCQSVRATQSPSSPALNIVEGPVMIESYASLWSLIHNQSRLGFSRERGGVSF